MNRQMVAAELIKVAKSLTAEDSETKMISEYQETLDLLERDIKRARAELTSGRIGGYAAHLAHQLRGGAYVGNWYGKLFG